MIHSKKLGFRFTVALSLLVLTITFGLQTSFAHNPQLKNGFLAISGNDLVRFSADKHQIGKLSLGFTPQQTVVNEQADVVYAAGSGVLQSYRLSDGSLLKQKNISGIVALAHDSARNVLYALNQEKRSIQLIDGKDLEVRSQIRLQNKPLDLAFNSQSDSLLVALDDQTIRELSASSGQETRRITDLDAPARKIVISQALDLLMVQHEKWVSVYKLSTLKFKDYLPLEGHPSRILVDEQNAQIYVQLSDEDSVAVFSQSLKLVNWISTAKRVFQGRKVDVSTMMLDSVTGKALFYDAKSQTLFSRDETQRVGPELLPSDPPPGVIPGPDILVNPNIDKGAQIQPNVEFDGSGNFVITWTDDAGNDGSGQGVFAREFNFDSTPANNEYQINKVTKGDQGTSTVHVNSDGDFTIAWRDANETDGDQFGVYMRQFVKGGTAKADDILVPQTTAGRQMAPSVSGDPGGKVIAAWSGPDDGAGRGTWMRLFDTTGAPIINEFLVNTSTAGNTWAVDVNANNSGEFVVVWRDDTNDRIRGRKFHADGTPVAGADFQAGPLGTGSPKNFEPSVGVFEDGSFIVAWRESSAGGICAEKFDANQNPIGAPFVVTSKQTEQQYSTSVAVAPDNSFVVVWRDSGFSNSDDIVARMFDSAGNPMGPDFAVPENAGNDEFECSVGSDNAGNFVVVWKDRNGPTSIAARYFMVGPPPIPMTVDSASPNTADRGASLTVNVVGTQFPNDAVANFNDAGITVNSTTFIDPQHLDVNITVTAAAFLGLHDISVTSSTGNATGQDLFAVKVGGSYPAPDVTSLVPPSGDQGKTLNVDINGTDFANDVGLSANFGPDITVNSLQFISGILIRANISIASTAGVGLRDVTVTNPGGASDTCTQCFDVIFNPTLYSDDFNDGDASDWIVDKGSWSAASQALANTSGDGKPRIISPFTGCGVCSFEADVKRGTSLGATVSVYGWWVDSKNYVELIMNKDKGKWILKHKVNGDLVNKDSVQGSIVTGQFYHVKLANDGTNFTATIDGSTTVSIPVTGTPFGTAAFKVKGTIGTFDNVTVLP